MSEPTRRWKDVLADRPVNETRVEIYKRLMEAQEVVAHALYRRGVSDAAVQEALDIADENLSTDERREDLYISALALYVGALGGRVEVRAILGDEEIVVRREPA